MGFELGQRVADYEIVSLLGVGGMGRVYCVRNVISHRLEAMKVLLADLNAEPDMAARFASEIRTLADLDHPNIAQLHTAMQVGNALVMMMEFVDGSTLQQLAKQTPLSLEKTIECIHQVLAALSFAHNRGVVHRDVKPANIIVTPEGIAKLTDFGIAKSRLQLEVTRPGTTVGSLYYMSPEQAVGDRAVDGRSDLYSVGILMYELLAGCRPFDDESTYVILRRQLTVVPPPPIEVNPLLSGPLSDLILKALEKDPAKRFQTAAAFSKELRRVTGIAPPTPVESAAVSASKTATIPVVRARTTPAALAAETSRFKTSGRRGLSFAAEAVAVAALMVLGALGLPHFFRAEATARTIELSRIKSQPTSLPNLMPKKEESTTPSSPAPAVAPLQEARNRKAALDARAAAVRINVQRLKSLQAAAGNGLGQDVAGPYVRMNAYLRAETTDLEEGDVAAARDHMDKAELDVNILEKLFHH